LLFLIINEFDVPLHWAHQLLHCHWLAFFIHTDRIVVDLQRTNAGAVTLLVVPSKDIQSFVTIRYCLRFRSSRGIKLLWGRLIEMMRRGESQFQFETRNKATKEKKRQLTTP
jgi:hypothetical protein